MLRATSRLFGPRLRLHQSNARISVSVAESRSLYFGHAQVVEPDWIDIDLCEFASDVTVVPGAVPEAMVEKLRKLLTVGNARLLASAGQPPGCRLLIGLQQPA
jgi:hypothetical protein